MKTKNIVILTLFVAIAFTSKAQTESTSKFSVEVANGFGFSVVSNEGFPTRLATSRVQLIGSYEFSKGLEISTGASLLGLNGNGFDSKGNFNQSRGVVRIPLMLNSTKPLNEKTNLLASGGVFASRILEDTFMYVNSVEEMNPDYLLAGITARLGISYHLYANVAIGVAYSVQQEFISITKVDSNKDVGMGTNSFDLFLKFSL